MLRRQVYCLAVPTSSIPCSSAMLSALSQVMGVAGQYGYKACTNQEVQELKHPGKNEIDAMIPCLKCLVCFVSSLASHCLSLVCLAGWKQLQLFPADCCWLDLDCRRQPWADLPAGMEATQAEERSTWWQHQVLNSPPGGSSYTRHDLQPWRKCPVSMEEGV